MKILLDECIPWPIRKLLPDHECRTAQHCGWTGKKNGELLVLAEREFDLFLTADQKLEYQQNLKHRTIVILMLTTNRLKQINPAAAMIQAAVASMKPGEYRRLEIP